jgi:DNA-binding CsgD family transcriptional regulator
MAPIFLGAASRLADVFVPFLEGGRERDIGRSYYGNGICATSTELLGRRVVAEHPAAIRYLHPRGVRDLWGIRVGDVSGMHALLALPLRRQQTTSSTRRVMGERLAAHLAAGLRLRRALAAAGASWKAEDGEAVLTTGGVAAHAVGAARGRDARAELRSAVMAMERARGRLQKDNPDLALAIWRGLVAGQWSLVDRFESDGRRYLIAHRNVPQVTDPRRLSARERQVVAYARLGHSNKLIAYELGLAVSSIGTHLARAMAKLGLRTRRDLIVHDL